MHSKSSQYKTDAPANTTQEAKRKKNNNVLNVIFKYCLDGIAAGYHK